MDPSLRRLLDQPPLSAAEERRLALLARSGDADARGSLVLAGMRSVVQRALLLGLRGDELRDGVQSGAIGLIRAVDRFDPDRGARLATFAWAWIGAAVRVERTPSAELDTEWADDRTTDEAWTWLDDMRPPASTVVAMRCGIGGAAPASRRAIAEHLGLTESRVRTIETEAMRHLRDHLARIGARAS